MNTLVFEDPRRVNQMTTQDNKILHKLTVLFQSLVVIKNIKLRARLEISGE